MSEYQETFLTLTPLLQAQLSDLIASTPRPRYSETVKAMLLEHGLITESEVSELKGEETTTTQANRARGKMPPHYKWGSLICYHADDIAAMIKAERVENAAYKRRKVTNKDLLGGAS
ncbi:hypothetical protein [Ruegeria arenilitoris]|uniref:hypothetical protein n=1 Tax=Ruegeria arenilitoris TaxID=1173585 RepID=UPI00147C11A7|nr:hypothetical protein [Ruegeria arenilitoris]